MLTPSSDAAQQRAKAAVRAEFQTSGSGTRAVRIFETGGLRIRFPRHRDFCEGVLINTGGGVVGGDEGRFDFTIGPSAHVLLTTQSAEKIYGGAHDPARIDVNLRLAAHAKLEWLPQETILFDGAKLRRTISIEMAEDASLTLLESVTFGRLAMGELIRCGSYFDRWRVRRNDVLVFADDTRLEGDMARLLDRPGCGGGARTIALLVRIGEGSQEMIDPLRFAMSRHDVAFGASLTSGTLIARFLARSPHVLREAIVEALKLMRGTDIPRVWQ